MLYDTFAEEILSDMKESGFSGRILITIDGPCASGKTTLAREIAEKLLAAVIHTDDYACPQHAAGHIDPCG